MNIKKDKIKKLKEFVNSPIAAGSALAGLNLCDIYLNVQDREYVLETIRYRFPNLFARIFKTYKIRMYGNWWYWCLYFIL